MDVITAINNVDVQGKVRFGTERVHFKTERVRFETSKRMLRRYQPTRPGMRGSVLTWRMVLGCLRTCLPMRCPVLRTRRFMC